MAPARVGPVRLERALVERAHDPVLAGRAPRGRRLAGRGRHRPEWRTPMKIMLLVSSMHAGGAERVAATLVHAWAERGDTVTLVPTYSGKGSCFYTVRGAVDTVWLADRT